jgi:hypothetical protein
MALLYRDLSAPADDTLTVFGKIEGPIITRTTDQIQLSVSDDNVVLIATGRVAPGNDVLASVLGKHHVLWTDGATHMTFLNEGTDTTDRIQATGGGAQHSFTDSVLDFSSGDRLEVLGYSAAPNPLLPLPPGVTETAFGSFSELNIDFNGGNAPTGHIIFNMSLPELVLTHKVSTETISGVPSLVLT